MELQLAYPKLLNKPRERTTQENVHHHVGLFSQWADHRRSVWQGWPWLCSWVTSVCGRYEHSYHVHRVVERVLGFFFPKVEFNMYFKFSFWQTQIFTLNSLRGIFVSWVVSLLPGRAVSKCQALLGMEVKEISCHQSPQIVASHSWN